MGAMTQLALYYEKQKVTTNIFLSNLTFDLRGLIKLYAYLFFSAFSHNVCLVSLPLSFLLQFSLIFFQIAICLGLCRFCRVHKSTVPLCLLICKINLLWTFYLKRICIHFSMQFRILGLNREADRVQSAFIRCLI